MSFPRAFLAHNWSLITRVLNYRYPLTTFRNWIPMPFPHQLRVLQWLPSSSSFMYYLITFKLEICYRYDLLVTGSRFVQFRQYM